MSWHFLNITVLQCDMLHQLRVFQDHYTGHWDVGWCFFNNSPQTWNHYGEFADQAGAMERGSHIGWL